MLNGAVQFTGQHGPRLPIRAVSGSLAARMSRRVDVVLGDKTLQPVQLMLDSVSCATLSRVLMVDSLRPSS